MTDLKIQCLNLDCSDPDRVATFWEKALGWRRTHATNHQVVLEPPTGSPQDGVAPDLLFLHVPEGKTVKNRWHPDLRPTDQAAEIARLMSLGATHIDGGVAGRADAAHGADEIVVVEQSADLLGTALAAAVRVQNRPCRAPERDGVADRGRGQSSSDKTRLIPLGLTYADMGI